MRFDKLTTKFQQAFAEAQTLANVNNNTSIESFHLLLALINDAQDDTISILTAAGSNVHKLKQTITAGIENLPKGRNKNGEISISRDMNNHLNITGKNALKHNDSFIASAICLCE